MGHSLTCYNDKCFYSQDYKNRTWLRLLCSEIDMMKDIPPWLLEAKEYWNEYYHYCVDGTVDLDLDSYLIDEARKLLFINICKKIISNLLSFGKQIPKNYLNTLLLLNDKSEKILEDSLTKDYLSYGNALIRLLMGKQKKVIEYI